MGGKVEGSRKWGAWPLSSLASPLDVICVCLGECAGTAEERGMSATRSQKTAFDEQLSGVGSDVYDLPMLALCRHSGKPFCRYVPFMPCFDSPDISGRLQRCLHGVCRCCASSSDGVDDLVNSAS